MSEEMNNVEELNQTEDMENVEVKSFSDGDIVKGTVTKIEEKQVLVDIEGSKVDGIIPISELSSLHVEKASDVVKEGDVLDLMVYKSGRRAARSFKAQSRC